MSNVIRTVALSLTIAICGCVNLSTPESTLGSAAEAVKKSNLKDFRKTMTQDLAAKFGNENSMRDFEKTLAPFSKLRVANKAVALNNTNSRGEGQVVYQLDVLGTDELGRSTRLYQVRTDCNYELVTRSSSDIGDCHEHPNGRTICLPGQWNTYETLEGKCLLSSVQ